MSLNIYDKRHFDKIVSCSVAYDYDSDLNQFFAVFNDDGPVYGPNGEWELDPDNNLCGYLTRPVFSTCKNNCPGGKLCYQSTALSNFLMIKLKTSADKLNISFRLRKYIYRHQQIIVK